MNARSSAIAGSDEHSRRAGAEARSRPKGLDRYNEGGRRHRKRQSGCLQPTSRCWTWFKIETSRKQKPRRARRRGIGELAMLSERPSGEPVGVS